jgi:DNA-binding SARP family transcriptional activator/tetratricopeptide (TPR) repeat protein
MRFKTASGGHLGDDMRFRILGPLEIWDGDHRVAVGGPQPRALLAILLLNANRVVSADRLVDALWDDGPPPNARPLMQGCIAQVRRALRTTRDGEARQPLATVAPGYQLEVLPGELDVDRFEELAEAARATALRSPAALDTCAGLLRDALALWRGSVLDGVAPNACRAEIARLEERMLTVVEERVDVDLRLGRHAELVGELRGLVDEHPFRERLWAQLMVALHGVNRQAEALEAYRRLRATLVDQLGIEPSQTLQDIERAVLVGADPTDAYRPPTASQPDAGPAPAPAGVASALRPAQLPADVATFSGRRWHLKLLDETLAEADGAGTAVAVATIVGTAGVGKTALAVHWAHRIAYRFPDGQLYVDLRGYATTPPLRPIEALAGFLYALGVPAEQIPADADQAAALFRTASAGRRLLVLLDNAAGVDQTRPLLPAGPGCLVLVTGRDALDGLVVSHSAKPVELDVLTADESFTLIEGLLGADRVAAETGPAGELAARCAHLPLALRIAAAHLIRHRTRRIAEQVALMGSSGLDALQIRGDERSAVRATFDLSYAALPHPAQRLFRLLGLVPGPDVTTASVAALAGADVAEATDLLARLADAHLIEEHLPGRFRFHDLLRAYAAERAGREPRAADAVERLFAWYVGAVDAAAHLLNPEMLRLPLPDGFAVPAPPVFEDDAAATRWLEAELPNLLAAARHAADHGPAPIAWLLTDRLRGYFFRRGSSVDWLEFGATGLAAAEAAGDLAAQATTRRVLGDAHLRQSRYRQATDHYRAALVLCRQTGWSAGEAAMLSCLGNVAWLRGELPAAADHYTRGLELMHQAGWLGGEAPILGNLGSVYWELGELERSAEYHSRSLALHRRLGSRFGEAIELCNLGELYQVLGRLDEAIDHASRGIELHRAVGDRGGESEGLRILAAAHSDAGRDAHAVQLAREAVPLAASTGNPRFEAEALNTLGTMEHRRGALRRAVNAHRRALRLAGDTGNRNTELTALIGLATTHLHADQPDLAAPFATQAVALATGTRLPLYEGQAHVALAAVDLAVGRDVDAVDNAGRGLAIARATGHRLGEAYALLLLGQGTHRTGDTDAAVERWQRALDLLSGICEPEAGILRALLAEGPAGPARARCCGADLRGADDAADSAGT